MKLGTTELTYGLFLAPLAGVSDRSFREVCRKHGAEYTHSEMISAKALCYAEGAKRAGVQNLATRELATIYKKEMPIAVQLFGREPEYMARAAQMIEERSYRGCSSDTSPVAIDINMGCPVRKITANGEGSALMREPSLAREIVRAVTRAVSLPVTVKIRAGWDSINAPEFAKYLEDGGASAVCVHARTKEQMYSPGIELSAITDTKKALSIPVIGNGDIYTAEDALVMLKESGCDGVMIARGSLGNPWIFSEIISAMEGRDYTAPTNEERLLEAKRHLESMILDRGERVAVAEGKKHVAWYIKGISGAASARNEIMNARSTDEMFTVLERLASR